jgi:hypothetical protein
VENGTQIVADAPQIPQDQVNICPDPPQSASSAFFFKTLTAL